MKTNIVDSIGDRNFITQVGVKTLGLVEDVVHIRVISSIGSRANNENVVVGTRLPTAPAEVPIGQKKISLGINMLLPSRINTDRFDIRRTCHDKRKTVESTSVRSIVSVAKCQFHLVGSINLDKRVKDEGVFNRTIVIGFLQP